MQLFIVKKIFLLICACLHFNNTRNSFLSPINRRHIPVSSALHMFSNSQYGTYKPFLTVRITNIKSKFRIALIGQFMFSCSLTGNHRNHRLNHLLSAQALVRTPWPLFCFSPGLSLWPRSRRRSVSICPTLLVCDPVTKNGDVSYWQDWGKLRVRNVRKETEMRTWSEGRN